MLINDSIHCLRCLERKNLTSIAITIIRSPLRRSRPRIRLELFDVDEEVTTAVCCVLLTEVVAVGSGCSDADSTSRLSLLMLVVLLTVPDGVLF